MIRIICFSLLMLSTRLFAQEYVIKEHCIDHKRGTPNREAAHAYYDQNTDKLFLTFMNKTTLYVNTYVNSQVKDHYEYIREEDPGLFNQVSAAVLRNEKDFYLFFANPTCADFSVTKINLQNKSIQQYPKLIHLEKDELYQYSFTSQDQFYIVTAVKNSSKFRIYKYIFENHDFFIYEYDIAELIDKDEDGYSYSVLWNVIRSTNDRFNARANFFKYVKLVNSESDIDPVTIAKPMKFYPRDGHLIITIDGFSVDTKMVDIDLNAKKYEFKEFEFPPIGANSEDVEKNSFVFEDVLLQVKVSKDSLLASVVDLKTKQRLQTYSCSAMDENIGFANSPIRKLTKSMEWGFEDASEIKKVKKALKTFSKNNIFIGAIRNHKGETEITIGSYYIVTNSYYNGMGAMGGASYMSQTNTEYLYFFKSLWSADYLTHVPNAVGESYYDKLLAKERNLTGPAKSHVIYKLPDQSYYLGYFKEFKDAPKNDFDSPPSEMYYCVERFGPKK